MIRENLMSLMSAAAFATVSSFVIFAIMATWYVAPMRDPDGHLIGVGQLVGRADD